MARYVLGIFLAACAINAQREGIVPEASHGHTPHSRGLSRHYAPPTTPQLGHSTEASRPQAGGVSWQQKPREGCEVLGRRAPERGMGISSKRRRRHPAPGLTSCLPT